MRTRLALILTVVLSVLGLAFFDPGYAHAANPVPAPAALSGHPFAFEWDGSTLAAAPFNNPQNAPGNCPANPSQVHLLSNGNAQLWTNGNANNCTSIQSPHEYPTVPGYVYEIKIGLSASSVSNWPAFWGYNDNWPNGGEIDAYEMQFHTNYVSWHYAPCNGQTSSSVKSTDPFTYDCKSNLNAVSGNISTGWHVIDYAFTTTGVDVYYDGNLYVHVPENLTQNGANPFWITVSDGSCNSAGNSVCASNNDLGVAGNLQIQYIRAFT